MTNNDDKFDLPKEISALVKARNAVRDHYNRVLENNPDHKAELNFTFDGNLVGDIGEAIAVELFDIKLDDNSSKEGIDGYIDIKGRERTVQVKAAGTKRGPAFRNTPKTADYLLFFDLDFEKGTGIVVYNGPEHYARSKLPEKFDGQRSLTRNQIEEAAELIKSNEQTPRRKYNPQKIGQKHHLSR